ncbi:extracellular solute-binding protein [Acrocarpospora macrocephala]|uniref:Sugar ABC transporter substrate-binding protein n=1 Tax=Acrocarpospora macrocephala TaxID=150177 RepID=A0A5M3WEG6_9ACTN|nr:maltose ABC transporter substrate-binding protein [Acrocarpospora macrocephala]GES06482.1 sugar ABC transporter substrate-binding protein [Acrocarpospora macrocephala]
MRKRAAGLSAALLGIVLGLTACGSDQPAAAPADSAPASAPAVDKGNGKLVIWADPVRTAALKPFTEQFGKENGVTVEIKEIAEELQNQFLTASQQGSGPDVLIAAHDWIGNLVQNGSIDPVQLTAEQKSAFQEIAIKAVTFGGQTYGAPYAVENLGLIRNTALAPEAPASVEALIESGQALKKAGKVSEILCVPVGQEGDAYHIYPFYSSAGGSLFGTTASGDPDPTKITVGDSAPAFTKLNELGKKGVGALKTSLGNDNTIATFASGKCAYLISGPWAIADVKKAGISYDVTAVPAFDGGDPATPFVGVQTFYVASKGKSKALAQEFVTNYVTNPDVAMALYNADPRPPALTAALDQAKAANPDMGKFIEAGKTGIPMPAIPQMAAIWQPFGVAEAAVINGGDPAKAAAAANKAITEAIEK